MSTAITNLSMDYALYPEDFAISKDRLIDYWIAEGFIEEVKNTQAKYDRGHIILNMLVNCCLLERAKYGCCVKMHDLIRDTVLWITSESRLFMVKSGVGLLEFPGCERSKRVPSLAKLSTLQYLDLEVMCINCWNHLYLLDNGQPSPPSTFQVIEMSEELWESLEWDQAFKPMLKISLIRNR
ncbi:hypothetical protein KPL71_021175 [Citrus sinensis]|uniref:Uncharacterized protein n=1 Tax=Citrus sinensis TaxID=2711 RepID=A0ACB8JDT3_CITSI|nr:hypothetical protein KPL71_021175 [Citrus sinensis]